MISTQKELSKRIVLSIQTKEERQQEEEARDWEALHKKTKSPHAWGPPPNEEDSTARLEPGVEAAKFRQWQKIHDIGIEKRRHLKAPGPRVKCQCEDPKCAETCAKEMPEAALVDERWCPECAIAIAQRRMDQIKNG